ncbi:hypothetical protein BC941DRAFT_426281 [Chlamydoabsidia padenii]|nr:hypothetical protein BC941DRAFT_426281 [Chlamydoabsidia padenii]
MNLPPELLGLIFQHLSQQRLPHCALVCQQWLQVARQHLYDSITLHSCSQTKQLITTLGENHALPPLGHLIRNIFGPSSGLDLADIKTIELHCSFLERINLGNVPYVPLWYHLKQLSLTSISFRDWRIGQWLVSRGHQLDQLTTNLDTFWGRCSPYASFTMIVMTCSAGHFANLVSLTLAKGDTASYYSHHSDPELELDPNLLQTIHRACPALTCIKFVYPRLPVTFKNIATTATQPHITTVTTTTTTTTIERYPMIRTLGLKISSRTTSLFFDLFAIMYPCVERLDLEIEEVNKGDDIRRRLRTPQLFDNYRARLFNMATSFKNLKEMRLHTTLTHDILEVYWAHHGWIDWIDAHSVVWNGMVNDNDNNDTIGQRTGRKRFERLDMTTQTGQHPLTDRDRVYVGNGNSLIQLSHLSISLDMVLPKLMTDALFLGRQTWPHLTTLQLKTNKHKVIAMDVLLSAAPHLVSLKLQSVTFKTCYWKEQKSVDQQQQQLDQPVKKRRIDYSLVENTYNNNTNITDSKLTNNNDMPPLHGLEKLCLLSCDLPTMDMITQWMARCPKLKELTGKGLDFYDTSDESFFDDYNNSMDNSLCTSMKQQEPLSLVSINDWTPYDKDDHLQSTPLVHINAPHHQLDYVSLEDIHYHDLANGSHYGLFLSLVVEQLWKSPSSSGPFMDVRLDYYANTPQKAFLTQKCSGSMIQSPKGYIKLTCQSLDNFVW